MQYVPYLADAGWLVDTHSLLDNDYLRKTYSDGGRRVGRIARSYGHRMRDLLTARKYDLIWVEKESLPWIPSWLERTLAPSRIPMVVDYDDATFHRYDSHPSRLVRLTLGSKIDHIMRGAAVVVVANRYLAEQASDAGAQRIEQLPTVVDLDRYRMREHDSHDLPTIGWIGTPKTAGFLDDLATAIPRVAEEMPVRFTTVGAVTRPFDAVPTRFIPWAESTEVESIQGFDIGIMPLPDTPWTRGKSSYKLIQYMACGIPVVASPVGMNTDVVDHGINGFLADTPDEWVRSLATLARDPELRMKMGREGRRLVETRYSLQANREILKTILESAVKAKV